MGALRKRQYNDGSPRQKTWVSMRILRAFTVADLAATADIAPGTVASYLQPLRQAGYVRGVRRGSNRGVMQYRLVRNSGPLAPVDWRTINILFDPNTGEEISYE